jgi:hypothetical protein
MDVELKTGGMARMPVVHDANTKRRTSSDVRRSMCLQSANDVANSKELRRSRRVRPSVASPAQRRRSTSGGDEAAAMEPDIRFQEADFS